MKTLDEEIRRGEQAKRLLEEPLLVEAFTYIEQELIEAWKNSPQRDTEGREKLHLSLCLLLKLKAQIQEVMETGEIAKKQSAIQTAKEKVSKIFKM